MPNFSNISSMRLKTCDHRLQDVFNEVVRTWDCSIICGHRSEEDQNKAYNEGRSKLKYPHSRHNGNPSKAVDVVPYYAGKGIDWNDAIGFAYFAGYVKRVGYDMGVNIRWGGDWDGDHRNKDQSFNDFPHFEIKE